MTTAYHLVVSPAYSHASHFQAVISGSAKCHFQFCLYLTALLPCAMELFKYYFSFLSLASDPGNRTAIPYWMKARGIEAWSCLASGIMQVTMALIAPFLIPFRSWQPLGKWFGGKGWHLGNNQVKSHKRENLKIIPSTTFFGRVEPDA